MLDENILQPIYERPDLPSIAAAINEKLSGERQQRAEFRRDLTPSVKSEFIGGEVVMHSPAKAKHLRATRRLLTLLNSFVQQNRVGEVFCEKALIGLTRNDYEPDVVYFGNEKAAKFTDDQMTFPAPDFVAEVLSESTATRDRGVKFDDYAMHGVTEYWIIDCDERSVEQYELRSGETSYHLKQKLASGEIESLVVPGFKIPVAAIFDDEANVDAMG